MVYAVSSGQGGDCGGGGSGCGPAEQPTLELFHPGWSSSWLKVYQFTNLHSAQLCDYDYYACDDSGDDPAIFCAGSEYGEQATVSLNDVLGADGNTWTRDRVMFFANCGSDCRAYLPNAPRNPSQGYFRHGGIYRYYEGAETSNRVAPLGPIISIGHIRRYRRGECSADAQLNAHWETIFEGDDPVWKPSFLEQLAQKLEHTLECDDHVKRATLYDSSIGAYLGTSDCHDANGEDRDYIAISLRFHVYPDPFGSDINYVTLKVDLRFRLLARRRSQYLDCPQKGEYTGCQQPPSCATRQCTTDADCCFHDGALDPMPGTYCHISDAGGAEVYGVSCNSEGQCEKESFLDVADDYYAHLWVRDHCTDELCHFFAAGLAAEVGQMQQHAYRDIYAPLLQTMYDETAKPTELLGCDDDEDCWAALGQVGATPDSLLWTACDHDVGGYCTVKPMLVRGVNLYPSRLEMVLAWTENDPEAIGLKALSQTEMCEPDPGWTPPRDEWLE